MYRHGPAIQARGIIFPLPYGIHGRLPQNWRPGYGFQLSDIAVFIDERVHGDVPACMTRPGHLRIDGLHRLEQACRLNLSTNGRPRAAPLRPPLTRNTPFPLPPR